MRRFRQDDIDRAQTVRANHDCTDRRYGDRRSELAAKLAANCIDRRTLRCELASRLGETVTAEVNARPGDKVRDIGLVATAPATVDWIGESRDEVSCRPVSES